MTIYDYSSLDSFPNAKKAAQLWAEHWEMSVSGLTQKGFDFGKLQAHYCLVFRAIRKVKGWDERAALKQWAKINRFSGLAGCLSF